MSNRKNHTDIDAKSRAAVHDRDKRRCAYCGRTDKPIELAHYVSRSRGGLGIPQNLISLCGNCHRDYDGAARREMQEYLAGYLKSTYPDWDDCNLIYRKE